MSDLYMINLLNGEEEGDYSNTADIFRTYEPLEEDDVFAYEYVVYGEGKYAAESTANRDDKDSDGR